MCGIAGALAFGKESADLVGPVERMTDAMRHRGPDGDGLVRCGSSNGSTVVLGHRRLAILDLSSRGAQPMRGSSLRRTWITYNGEIYNFRELRRDLEGIGHSFESSSDTEVILRGYEAWGSGVVPRLRGMFAFGLWDGDSNTLLLARDPLGQKPLYVYRDGTRLLFASEVRALLASGIVPRKLDPIAVEQYLAYQCVPAPRTLVEQVVAIGPGSLATVTQDGDLHESRYWDLLDNRRRDVGQSDRGHASAEIRRVLEELTPLHLVSDVPVGMFLSGGIDSSAIVSLVKSAGIRPRTFAVTFPGTPYDEGRYASLVARHFGAEHHEVPLLASDVIDRVSPALDAMDHPSGDGINSFIVSSAVRSAGLKVALSGLGGDELFGGYPSFSRLERLSPYARAFRRTPSAVRRAAASAVRSMNRPSIATAKTAALLEGDGSIAQSFPVLRQLFTTAERRDLLADRLLNQETDPYVRLLEEAVERHPDADTMTLVSYAEARTYMHDVLLRDTDQMSMHHGLEVRVPFLDTQLAALVMGLPSDVKQGSRVPKQALIESLPAPLPDDCVRRPKQGFVLPMADWMRGSLRDLCEMQLGSRGLAGKPFMRAGGVETLWRRFLADDGATSWSRPWALVALNAWIDRHNVTLE